MKKYGFTKDLYIKLDDEELINVSEKFLLDVERNFTDFKEEYDKSFSNLQSYMNIANFIFEPEKLSKKSPLTIINAPWGTGKTFFIENFIKLFIDKKIKSDIFKKIIIIDAWKFSNSKDVPVEFAIELSNKIINMHISNESEKIKAIIKQRILDWIIPDSLTWKLNFFNFLSLEGKHTNKNLKENEKEEKKEIIESAWKKIQENTEPTIIFIDNLERLGSSSWDLLKAILKIQEFDNYLIVLPLNLNKFNNNKRVDNSEYPIEKYIDFNYYNLQQDYSNFFNKHIKENREFINKLNLIFNSEIDGEKLSIREVENSFKTHNLFRIKDEYEVLRTIKEYIWDPKEIFNNFLREDAKYFLEIERKKCRLFLQVVSKISERDSRRNFTNISDIHLKDSNNVFLWERNQRYKYQPNFNYLNDYNNLLNKINFKKKENLKKIKNINNAVKDLNQKKLPYENKKNELKIKIAELIKQEQNEATKMTEYNPNKHGELQTTINLTNQKLKELELKISEFEVVINNHNNDLVYLDENNSRMFDIAILIVELKEINNIDKLTKKQKEEILLILKNKFGDLNYYIENNYNFDFSKISW